MEVKFLLCLCLFKVPTMPSSVTCSSHRQL
jgi:hypothetical protein